MAFLLCKCFHNHHKTYLKYFNKTKQCQKSASNSFCDNYPNALVCCGYTPNATKKTTPNKKLGKDELLEFCEEQGFANTDKSLDRCGDYISLKN
jgi:hypothetical protein